MKIVAVVQARMSSSRLPGKVMREVTPGLPMIEALLSRLTRSRTIDEVVVATSEEAANDPLEARVAALGLRCIRGSERDVLDRYRLAAEVTEADVLVRITGDCPFVDPNLVDHAVEAYRKAGVDYFSNIEPPTYPDGLDIEVFASRALLQAATETADAFDREHVTPYLRRGPFTRAGFRHDADLSHLRWTVDEADDLTVARRVYGHFAPRTDFTWQDILALQEANPELFKANAGLGRNEGATMGSGQKLWRRAKQVIPGGNMLLSKRAEMFLPDQWPAYFSRSEGCRLWDLDGRELIDMSLMGVGTNTLGYSHPEVDAAVIAAVQAGNLSTLNAPEEVALAERLLTLDPWAGMVRFARTGGEANAVAVRIARAAAGRDGVAICGYHGWHDWYLSANLGADDSLSGHLLPGLDPNGVPAALRGTVHPFQYNDLEALKTIVRDHRIGVIKMEVSRNQGPQQGFLEGVRQLASDNGIVLVFDECTSGFRETFGGLYKKFGVEPDMVVYGKTLGNGYAITAIVGRTEVMEAAQTTFISSTFWTERIGPAAAIKALEVMEREQSWDRITAIGTQIRTHWQALADRHGLKINHAGLPALATFSIESKDALAYKTLITQEMLDKGWLASTAFYATLAHTPDIIDAYVEALDPVFAKVRECEDGLDVNSLLRGPICHAGFKRLN